MELEVIFDREDRLYKFGEVISGKVVLRPESDRTYSKIWITYHWRTHGQGNRDGGNDREVILVEEDISLKSGECMELPFRFDAPNGPVTYHGRLLNVDWYLTAHAQSIPRSSTKSLEYDFLLQCGDPTDMVILGYEGVPLEDLPDRSVNAPHLTESSMKNKVPKPKNQLNRYKIMNWITLFSSMVIFLSIFDAPRLFFLLPFFILIIAALTYVIRGHAYKRYLEPGKVWVSPNTVWRGGKVYCHIDFLVKKVFHLRRITASISAQERITKTAGTITETKFRTIKKKDYTQPYNEMLYKGRQITFDCALEVSPEAPATFSCFNNALEWTVTMRADIKGWSEWQMTFPITVLPGVSRDEKELSVMLDEIRPAKRS